MTTYRECTKLIFVHFITNIYPEEILIIFYNATESHSIFLVRWARDG